MTPAVSLAAQATYARLAGHCARSVLPRVSIEDEMSGSLLTAGDVAELLGVPKSWVHEHSRAGGIDRDAGLLPPVPARADRGWLEELERSRYGD
jgi:hypothetical protein